MRATVTNDDIGKWAKVIERAGIEKQ